MVRYIANFHSVDFVINIAFPCLQGLTRSKHNYKKNFKVLKAPNIIITVIVIIVIEKKEKFKKLKFIYFVSMKYFVIF